MIILRNDLNIYFSSYIIYLFYDDQIPIDRELLISLNLEILESNHNINQSIQYLNRI